MDYDLKIVTEPQKEPVSLAEVKLDRGIDAADATFNSLLEGMITAARLRAEHDTNRFLIEQTWDLRFIDGFPTTPVHYIQSSNEIRIPRAPLKATAGITHVKYLDSNGAQQTFAAGAAGYVVGVSSGQSFIVPAYGISWPSTRNWLDVNGNWPVEVRFIAGYGPDPSDVPAPLREAIRLIVGARFENREDVDPGQLDIIPDGAASIFSRYYFSPR